MHQLKTQEWTKRTPQKMPKAKPATITSGVPNPNRKTQTIERKK